MIVSLAASHFNNPLTAPGVQNEVALDYNAAIPGLAAMMVSGNLI